MTIAIYNLTDFIGMNDCKKIFTVAQRSGLKSSNVVCRFNRAKIYLQKLKLALSSHVQHRVKEEKGRKFKIKIEVRFFLYPSWTFRHSLADCFEASLSHCVFMFVAGQFSDEIVLLML